MSNWPGARTSGAPVFFPAMLEIFSPAMAETLVIPPLAATIAVEQPADNLGDAGS